ncbi:Uncharacterised protein [Mycobacteroides abscessus subsp. abscessus]|uniref:hypothetical protein n=1 Tax=Mycobacteroides abscessus TaxID=36809 RepID=UPI000926B34A|nr:hypothetical protein [Mycobacteroides abscessus]SHT11244.1 Uncharacterised protein [Mycobacteroides abscessus subsp. abscessus]SKO62099.1 Uncharacterised protein [Mycobacteroides abscessus subsp. abscessus]
MTDPAVEAVRRARHYRADYSWEDKVSGLASAREALKPIREWYFAAMAYNATIDDLAPLIFTTEEMNR